MIPRNTGLIVAMDVELGLDRLKGLAREIYEYVDAFKLGWYQLLTIGPGGIAEFSRDVGKYVLVDIKLGDVGHINSYVVSKLGRLGVNGVIMHAVAGEPNVRQAVDEAKRVGLDIFLLVSMSMGGEIYDKHLEDNVKMGLRLGVAGFIAPATKPNIIKAVRGLAGDRQILAPGVGPQGGKPGCAIASGADFEIVGRLIVGSGNPRLQAMNIVEAIRRPSC